MLFFEVVADRVPRDRPRVMVLSAMVVLTLNRETVLRVRQRWVTHLATWES